MIMQRIRGFLFSLSLKGLDKEVGGICNRRWSCINHDSAICQMYKSNDRSCYQRRVRERR